MTAEDFQSAYEEWKRQLRIQGKPPLSIAHFGAAICTQQEEHLDELEEHLDELKQMVNKALGVNTSQVGHC